MNKVVDHRGNEYQIERDMARGGTEITITYDDDEMQVFLPDLVICAIVAKWPWMAKDYAPTK